MNVLRRNRLLSLSCVSKVTVHIYTHIPIVSLMKKTELPAFSRSWCVVNDSLKRSAKTTDAKDKWLTCGRPMASQDYAGGNRGQTNCPT